MKKQKRGHRNDESTSYVTSLLLCAYLDYPRYTRTAGAGATTPGSRKTKTRQDTGGATRHKPEWRSHPVMAQGREAERPRLWLGPAFSEVTWACDAQDVLDEFLVRVVQQGGP